MPVTLKTHRAGVLPATIIYYVYKTTSGKPSVRVSHPYVWGP